MIARLRRRFVRIVMESFAVVLILILVGVNLVNRHNVYTGIDARLTFLSESTMGPPVGMVASTPWEIRSWVDMNAGGIMNERSYFIFTGYMSGPILQHQLDVLSAASGMDASALLTRILAGTQLRGNAGPYRYLVASRQTPYKVVFLRCQNEFDSLRSLLMTSILVGLVSLLLVLGLAAALSGRAIRPFAENIENQKRFISNASHELKTPLGVIMSDLDIQIMESGPTEWLTNAQAQADHLSLLIRQLTSCSLLSENKPQWDELPVDLSGLCQGLLADFRPLALNGGQDLTADIQPEISVPGNGDAFRTLLSVLLDNAVKYAPEGGRIHLSLRKEKRAVLRLTNSCRPEDDTDLDHVFERFYRSPENRAAGTGHGLGLSIAHDIAVMYGGSIRADREENGDITFTVEF